VAQKHNETFLRNSTETKKLREQTTHLCNELKRLVKAEKSTFSIARRNLFSDAKSNSVGNEFQSFITRSLKKVRSCADMVKLLRCVCPSVFL